MQDEPTSELRRARISVSLIFLIHGILVSNWLSRIPAVQAKLHLPVGILGATLLATAAGALIAMPLTSKLVGRFGSARVTRAFTLALCASVVLPGLAWNAPMLAVALFIYGAAAGAMDVAMNTEAVVVETGYGRPVMVAFHALFSFGGMIGSLMGSLAASRAIAPHWHLLAVGAVLAVASIPICRHMLVSKSEPLPDAGSTLELLRPLIGLGVVAFCILLGEGAMADWSAVYLREFAGPGIAPLGYAVFSLAMALGRLLGDWFHLAPRIGCDFAVGRGTGSRGIRNRAAVRHCSCHANRLRLRRLGLLGDLSDSVLGGRQESGEQAASGRCCRYNDGLFRLPGGSADHRLRRAGFFTADRAVTCSRAERCGVRDGGYRADQ